MSRVRPTELAPHAVFLLIAGWLLVNTLLTAPTQATAGLLLVALGLPFYFYWSRQLPRSAA